MKSGNSLVFLLRMHGRLPGEENGHARPRMLSAGSSGYSFLLNVCDLLWLMAKAILPDGRVRTHPDSANGRIRMGPVVTTTAANGRIRMNPDIANAQNQTRPIVKMITREGKALL